MRCFQFQRFFSSLLKTTPADFWPLFNEKDPRKYQLLLQSSGFLDTPLLLSPKFSALLIYSYTKKTPFPFDPKVSQKLLSLYELHKSLMNKQDFVNVSWAFSKLFPKNPSLWLDLEEKILINSKEFTLRETITIIHSFSRVFQGSEQFWTKQEIFLMPQIDKLGEKELSIVVWAFSNKNRYKNEEIWQRFESQILALRLKDIEFISSLIYSFGKAKKGSLALWASFEKNIVVNLQGLTSRYLSNIVWAFAKAGKNFNNPLLEKYIETWISEEISEGNEPRDLMNVLWGLNKLDKGDARFYEVVFRKLEEKKRLLKRFNGQDLINLAWIYRNRVFGKMPKEILKRFLWFLEENMKEIEKGKGMKDVKIKAHECFYEGEGGVEVWREKGEEFCLKYVKEGGNEGKGEVWKENLKEIGILVRKFDGPPNSQNYKELKELLNKYR